MKTHKIRNLATGEVLERKGATAMEILQQDGFVPVGREPKGWKPPKPSPDDKE